MCRWLIVAAFVTGAVVATPILAVADDRPTILAEDVRAHLAEGPLENVRIIGTIDLADLHGVDLRLNGVEVDSFRAASMRWRGMAVFEDVKVRRWVDFRGTIFSQGWTCRFCQFSDDVIATRAIFEGPLEMIAARFDKHAVAYFDAAQFKDVAGFQGTQFGHQALFTNSVFEQDVSFVKTFGAKAYFAGSQFRADLEMRSCCFDHLQFGVNSSSATDSFGAVELVTLFAGAIDLRRCKLGYAGFERTFLNGVLLARGATFGSHGLAFVGATASAELIDLRGAKFIGPLFLKDALLPGLRLNWTEASSALQAAKADATVYEAVAARLQDAGAQLDSRRADYLAKRENWQTWPNNENDPLVTLAEWWIWTLPTVNGTNLVRPLFLALVLWSTAGTTLLPIRRRMVIVPRSNGVETKRELIGRSWETLPQWRLPEGSYTPVWPLMRVLLTYAFAFELVFKFAPWRTRYASRSHANDLYLEAYFLVLWLVGFALLAIVALTLAILSPPLRSILPQI
jgi:hypothetical protein